MLVMLFWGFLILLMVDHTINPYFGHYFRILLVLRSIMIGLCERICSRAFLWRHSIQEDNSRIRLAADRPCPTRVCTVDVAAQPQKRLKSDASDPARDSHGALVGLPLSLAENWVIISGESVFLEPG